MFPIISAAILGAALAAAPASPPVAAPACTGAACRDDASAATPMRPPRDRGSVDVLRPTGLALLAAGSASAISGAVLIGLDGKDVRRRCSQGGPQAVDHSGDCRFVHDTLTPGIAALSGGILAVAGGITILSIERRRRKAVVRARLGYNRIVISGRF
jgi:hypothetical protein